MRATKKAFSGSVSDLEKFLTWECKERNKETKAPEVAPEYHARAQFIDCAIEGAEHCRKCGFTK